LSSGMLVFLQHYEVPSNASFLDEVSHIRGAVCPSDVPVASSKAGA